MESCVPKVQELRTRFPTKDIQVDGGVGPGTVGCCARAGMSSDLASSCWSDESTGSNVIVAGTALFGASDPAAVMVTMKEAVESSRPGWGLPAAKA